MNEQFKNIKVHVPTPEISTMVQNKLFDMGFSWSMSGKNLSYVDKKYLYVHKDGDIFYGSNHKNFEEDQNNQVHYLQILTKNLDGVLFKHNDPNDDLIYYLLGEHAYWVSENYTEICNTSYRLQKSTKIVDVNEEDIDMNNKMPKLEAGKHVVMTKYGLALVVEHQNHVAFSYLKHSSWGSNPDLVKKVYTLPHPIGIFVEDNYNESNLIWTREEESKRQVREEYERLQQKIKDLEEQSNKLGKILNS